MRFLLRPAWLALITTVTLFVIACYAVLAPWQFGREADRDAEQQALDIASTIPPAPLAQVLPPDGVTAAVEWRQVTVTGTYLADAEAVVRLRVYDGKPAFEVLTPLRTTDGQVVAVDRGYATAESGAAVPAYAAPPTGRGDARRPTARRRDRPRPPARRSPPTGTASSTSPTPARLATATGLPITPGYLALTADQPGVLAPLPVVPAAAQSAAPFTNLSYALQWLTFGAIAVFALVYFVRLEMLQRGAREAPPRRNARRVRPAPRAGGRGRRRA